VVVELGRSRKANGAEWTCPYRIRGLGLRGIRYAKGLDAIQALLMALDGIRAAPESSGRPLVWAGGDPGESVDTGFPRFVPTFFGAEFSRRMGRLIDREVEKRARELEGKHRRHLTHGGRARPQRIGRSS
ncbi:MAG TPA: hypothetical protein VIM86_15400, partial [Thermodesulfobacteriota bacterium]